MGKFTKLQQLIFAVIPLFLGIMAIAFLVIKLLWAPKDDLFGRFVWGMK